MAQGLLLTGLHRFDHPRQHGPADDDLAPSFALAAVDGPERFEALHPGLKNPEAFDVVGDIVERPSVASAMYAVAACIAHGRLQLR